MKVGPNLAWVHVAKQVLGFAVDINPWPRARLQMQTAANILSAITATTPNTFGASAIDASDTGVGAANDGVLGGDLPSFGQLLAEAVFDPGVATQATPVQIGRAHV